MARFNDLPDELAVEILAYLPADSLMRFKCVKKSWYSLIANPKFVVKHLCNQIYNKSSFLLKCRLFANSARREFRELPVSCFHPSQGAKEVVCLPLGFGFGYDPKPNDYKVIRILYFIDNFGCGSPIKVEVYTLSTDSWREVNVNLFAAGICFLQRFECVNFSGACYWMAWGDFHGTYSFILSFNIIDETFKKIPLPNSTLNACKDSWELLVLNGSLAFVLHDTYVVQSFIKIWIMDAVGVDAKWKKNLTAKGNHRLQKPLAFGKKDELITEDKAGKLYRYNLCTQKIKDLPVRRPLRKYSAVNYLSSLVSVRGGNKLELGHQSLTREVSN